MVRLLHRIAMYFAISWIAFLINNTSICNLFSWIVIKDYWKRFTFSCYWFVLLSIAEHNLLWISSSYMYKENLRERKLETICRPTVLASVSVRIVSKNLMSSGSLLKAADDDDDEMLKYNLCSLAVSWRLK